MVDYADLIGVPFQPGGRGPDTLDCYGLVAEMYWRTHGRRIPEFDSTTVEQGRRAALGASQMASPRWQEVPRQAGVVAAIRIAHVVTHCGFMLDDHTLIHSWERSGGVSVQRIGEWERRIVGFYRYAG